MAKIFCRMILKATFAGLRSDDRVASIPVDRLMDSQIVSIR
jgi:hypothetical protein